MLMMLTSHGAETRRMSDDIVTMVTNFNPSGVELMSTRLLCFCTSAEMYKTADWSFNVSVILLQTSVQWVRLILSCLFGSIQIQNPKHFVVFAWSVI